MPFFHSHSEMISPSSVTIIVPAAVPNNRTEVKTNVSETEIEASILGSLIVIDPLSKVSAASTNHCDVTGVVPSASTECAITTNPAITIAPTNN